jgi:hypothetical protein
MVASTIDRPAAPADFAERHPADHVAVLIMVGLCWFAVLAGFIPDMLHNWASRRVYTPVTHAHAFLAVSWMSLLTAQGVLAARGDVARHMAVGRWGRWLAPLFVVVSIVTAFVADFAHRHDPTFVASRLAFQISHVLVFGALAAAAFALTGRPSAHKRLLLLATIALLDAGFSRWLGDDLKSFVGVGPFGQWAVRFPLLLAMVGLMGAYDMATRRRLHAVYLPAAALIAGSELLALWLAFWPPFMAACNRLFGLA